MRIIKVFLVILLFLNSTLDFKAQNREYPINKYSLQKAFNDLTYLYENQITPPYKIAFENSRSSNDSIRSNSLDYIQALLILTLEDETNKRSPWQGTPFFNETWNSTAQNFRKALASFLGKNANSPEFIKIAEWMIYEDNIQDDKLEGIKIIRRIKNDETNAFLRVLISNPNFNEAITINTIEEITDRNLSDLFSKIDSLQNHYRSKIRSAAILNGEKIDLKQRSFDTLRAITPWIELQLQTISSLILDSIPEKAVFVNIVTEEPLSPNNKKWINTYTGWLIKEDSLTYSLLDYSAQNFTIKKKYASLNKASLKEEAIKLSKHAESSWQEPRRAAVRIHQNYEEVPYLTMAVWCYKHNMRAQAASLLFPLIDRTSDDNIFAHFVVNLFGDLYYNDLLFTFTHERNYLKSIRISEHLSKNDFSVFRYQKLAVELGKQLSDRSTDFNSLILPSEENWIILKSSLTRKEQIDYLMKRIRLLNCIQDGQPGGINYDSNQYSISESESHLEYPGNLLKRRKNLEKFLVINPYKELINMQLDPDDIEQLAPYLADNSFILGYNFWRDFHYRRTLHRVSWVISDIIHESICKEFINLNEFQTLSQDSQQIKIDEIILWCESNKYKPRQELIIDILKTTENWSEFEMAMNKCLEDNYTVALPVLIDRIHYFSGDNWPSNEGQIAKAVFLLGPNENADIKKIRKWQSENDGWVKLWSSLYLIKNSDSLKYEGFNTLKEVLNNCDGRTFYPHAIETLIKTHNTEAFALAEGILEKEGFRQNFYWDYYSGLIKELFLAGSEKAYLFLKEGLENTNIDQPISELNSCTILFCDNYIDIVSKWRNSADNMSIKSVRQRKVESKKLATWLELQYGLAKEGKKTEIDISSESNHEPYFYNDSPNL